MAIGDTINQPITLNLDETGNYVVSGNFAKYFRMPNVTKGILYEIDIQNSDGRDFTILQYTSPSSTYGINRGTNSAIFVNEADNLYFAVHVPTVTDKNITTSFSISFKKRPMHSLEIAVKNGTIHVGENIEFRLEYEPAISFGFYTYCISSDEGILKPIDHRPSSRDKKFETLKAGTVTLTIKYDDKVYDTVTVNVIPPYDYPKGSGTENDPYLVSNVDELNGVRSRKGSHFKQVANIDLSGIDFLPIGTVYTQFNNFFNCTYDGGNYKISNLTINPVKEMSGAFSNRGALFSKIGDDVNKSAVTTLKNIKLVNPQIRVFNRGYAAGFVGYCDGGSINMDNCHVIDGFVGSDNVTGGLIGELYSYSFQKKTGTKITNCSTSCDVESRYWIAGGLIGAVHGIRNNLTIEKCFTTGKVISYDNGGGFIGEMDDAGLVTIKDCYSTGNIMITDKSGIGAGFIGVVVDDAILNVTNCYSSGHAAHLVDENKIRGFIGEVDADVVLTITSCYYDSEVSGLSDDETALPRTTEQMKQKATFIDWDFTKVWDIKENKTYPFFIIRQPINKWQTIITCKSLTLSKRLVP